MFGSDYFVAREAFRRGVAGAHTALNLDARAPNGEALTIDVAWLGDEQAQRVLLINSGLHGVEGFAGSAVQCAFLAAKGSIAPGCAVVLAHALNPWGYAHLRRVNENNVDLNRNFLAAGERYAGAPPGYRLLDAFLNPSATSMHDLYYPRALWLIARHGIDSLRQTISGGQYEFERGLFFGGHALEQGPRLFLDWLQERCARVKRLFTVDLHTGLGRFGALTVFSERHHDVGRNQQLSRALGMRIRSPAGLSKDMSFQVRGSLCAMLPQVLPNAEVDALTVEFGTYAGMRVLRALRDENRWHHYGGGTLDHPAKRYLLETFRPDSAAWRAAVISQGTALLRRSLAFLSAD